MTTDMNATDLVVRLAGLAVEGKLYLGHESNGVRSSSSTMIAGQDTVIIQFNTGQSFRVAVSEET